MLNGKRVVVVMPAYNAARTLERTYRDLDLTIVDEVIVVDDRSTDETPAVARRLGLRCVVHDRNRGYGANQKTCYRMALDSGADIVIMVHPDYQYDPRLVPALASLLASGVYDCALGSRVLGRGALAGGMPSYKYVANRFLTLVQNILSSHRLSEYHTGYRAFTRQVLERLPLERNSDDFLFDNQMLAQVMCFGFRIGEISCPVRYFPEASSIGFARSVRYGLGVLAVSLQVWLQRRGLTRAAYLTPVPRGAECRP